jgi:hypothetical protein
MGSDLYGLISVVMPANQHGYLMTDGEVKRTSRWTSGGPHS